MEDGSWDEGERIKEKGEICLPDGSRVIPRSGIVSRDSRWRKKSEITLAI
jgi:hypothetical protein